MLWSPAWDLAMRAVGALWTGLLLWTNGQRLMTFVATDHPTMTTGTVVTAVAARVALLGFLATLALFFVVRLRPVAKVPGIGPRMVALCGTLLPTTLSLLPRYEDWAVLNAASFAAIAVSSALSMYGFSYLSRSASIMAEARRLVTSGPYRLVRHPVYLFEELGVIGTALSCLWPPDTAAVAVVVLTVHAWCQIRRMQLEERVLESAFPDYSAYRVGTPARVIPGVY
jgi:protein-S-isoprenylcysteine O-methyltransferase Ste14